MSLLRIFVVLGLLVSLGMALSDVDWKGYARLGYRIAVVDLPSTPVWAPPEKPTSADFSAAGTSLPLSQSATAAISVQWSPYWASINFVACAWCVMFVSTVVYLVVRETQRDSFHEAVLGALVGLTVSFLLSLAIWILLGGWGLPWNGFIGIAGAIVGLLVFGVRQYTIEPPRRMVHKL